MATKKFAQMSSKKLNALLETASEEDRIEIQKVLDARESAQGPVSTGGDSTVIEYENENPLTPEEEAAIKAAEENGGNNPFQEKRGRSKPEEKMSNEELHELAEKCKAEALYHKCLVVPFNSIEWVSGVVAGIIEERRSNKVLYAIKTDDGRRIVKVHGSKLIKILEETIEPEIKRRGPKKQTREKAAEGEAIEWTPEAIKEAIKEAAQYVGKIVSFKAFKLMKKEGEVDEDITERGRIVSVVPDKRACRLLYRIELFNRINEDGEEIKTKEKRIAHKIFSALEFEGEDFDDEGREINEKFVSRRVNGETKSTRALTPQEEVEVAEKALETAKKMLEKYQALVEKREGLLKEAKEKLAKYLDEQMEGGDTTDAPEATAE